MEARGPLLTSRGVTVQSLESDLEQRTHELEDQRNLCVATFERCKAMKIELQNEVCMRKSMESGFQEQLFSANSEIGSLSAALNHAKRELDELRNENSGKAQLEQNFVALKNNLNKAMETAQCAINEKNALQQQIARFSASIGELTALNDSLNANIKHKESGLARAAESICKLQETVVILKSEIEKGKEKEQSMQMGVDRLKTELKKAKALSETGDSAILLVKGLKEEMKKLNSEKVILQGTVSDMQKKVFEGVSALESRDSVIASLKLNVSELEKQNKFENEELNKLRSRLESETCNAQQLSTSFLQDIKSKTNECEEMKELLSVASSEMKNMKLREEEYQNAVSELAKRIGSRWRRA